MMEYIHKKEKTSNGGDKRHNHSGDNGEINNHGERLKLTSPLKLKVVNERPT